MSLTAKLRMIRLMIQTIVRQTLSHAQRNGQMLAVNREIVVIANEMARAGIAPDHALVDGVRAVETLTHDGLPDETHRDVKARLWLAVALTDWLIAKAEDFPDLPGWWRDVVSTSFEMMARESLVLTHDSGDAPAQDHGRGDIPF